MARRALNKIFSGVQGGKTINKKILEVQKPRGAGSLLLMIPIGGNTREQIPSAYPHSGPLPGVKRFLAAGGMPEPTRADS